jgi:coenzyme F420-reducing hydrogenase gamma subunit
MGGIQSQRNRLPKKLIGKAPTRSVSDVIKVDYTIPGCPISQKEAISCLLDAYWGKVFTLPDVAVCFECRQNENQCHLKHDRPCLGPITRAGCNSACVNGGEICFGCRGPIEQANFKKMRQILDPVLEEQEIENLLTVYGNYEKEHEKLTKDK